MACCFEAAAAFGRSYKLSLARRGRGGPAGVARHHRDLASACATRVGWDKSFATFDEDAYPRYVGPELLNHGVAIADSVSVGHGRRREISARQLMTGCETQSTRTRGFHETNTHDPAHLRTDVDPGDDFPWPGASRGAQ